MPTLRSVIIGPSLLRDPKDPLVAIVPSLIKQVLCFITVNPSPIFLKHLTLVDIDHNTPIPPYFNDSHLLVHLAFIPFPQLGDNAREKLTMDYMDTEEKEVEEKDDTEEIEVEEKDDDADIEMLDSPPPIFMTPRKKKAFKVKEKLDDSFLRRSKRISSKL
jgi:hypothetical protein